MIALDKLDFGQNLVSSKSNSEILHVSHKIMIWYYKFNHKDNHHKVLIFLCVWGPYAHRLTGCLKDG